MSLCSLGCNTYCDISEPAERRTEEEGEEEVEEEEEEEEEMDVCSSDLPLKSTSRPSNCRLTHCSMFSLKPERMIMAVSSCRIPSLESILALALAPREEAERMTIPLELRVALSNGRSAVGDLALA